MNRAVILAGLTTFTSGSAFAADRYWDGSEATQDWSLANNWSDSTSGGGTGVIPTSADAAVFRVTNPSTNQTILVGGARPVQAIKTITQGSTTTLAAGSAASVIQIYGAPNADPLIGTDGILHNAGALTIGTANAVPASRVNITIHSPVQTWTSSVLGGSAGAAAVVVNNGISAGIGGNVTLKLSGTNTGTTINGVISDGAGTLNLELRGTNSSNVWTLTGANQYSGTTTVTQGTLRLSNADSIPASALDVVGENYKVIVKPGATLALRMGPGAFSEEEIQKFSQKVKYEVGGTVQAPTRGFLALDTVNEGAEVNGGLNGNHSVRKLGLNPLILGGPHTFTGKMEVAEGTMALRRPNNIFPATALPITATGSTALLAIIGEGGFTESQFPQGLVDLASSTSNIGISTVTGDRTYSGGLLPTRRIVKGDPGTLTLLGSRTDVLGVNITGGTLRLLSLPPGTGASPVGNSNAQGNLWLTGGRLMYAGPALTTDRPFHMNGNGTLDSSGSGPLVLNSTAAYPHQGTSARTLTITGSAPGENKITGPLQNAGAGALGVTKQGSASWTLAGTNTYTGVTRNNGGKLTLDYTSGTPISTGQVLLNAGQVLVKVPAPATKTFPSFQLSANQHTAGHLKLEGGVGLTISSLSHGGQSQRGDLLDLSGNANNSITISALNGNNNIRVVNGILVANAADVNNGRGNIILRDTDGTYGFPTLSGTTSGTLAKVALTTVPTGNFNLTSNTTHYKFGPGTYTAQSHAIFNTVTMDSGPLNANNTINVGFGFFDLTPSGTGKAMLFTGYNNINLTGNAGGDTVMGQQPIWFNNYLEPGATLDIPASFGSGQSMFFAGSGFTIYRGQGYSGNFVVNGALVRIARDEYLAHYAGEFRVSGGGVLEIGADLNSFNDGDFTKAVRVVAAGSSNAGGIAFYGDSGVSGYAANPATRPKRIVNFSDIIFEGATEVSVSQPLVWGASRFLTQPDSDLDGDYTFKLSSPKSNVTIEVQNTIDLNGRSRTVEVADGSAAIDAELSGVLTGGGAAGIVKTGPGTLYLSGKSTYKGETRVLEGTLQLQNDSVDPASTIEIVDPVGGGTTPKIQVVGSVTVAAVTINGVAQPPGQVVDPTHVSGGSLVVGGLATPYQQWVTQKALAAGESAGDFDADFDGIKNLVEYAVGSEPKTPSPSVLTKLPGSPSAVRFNRAAGRTDLNLFVESSPTLGAPWTVIATSTAGAALTSSVGATVTVSETTGTVTVTDNRTPQGKMFYRLRAEIP